MGNNISGGKRYGGKKYGGTNYADLVHRLIENGDISSTNLNAYESILVNEMIRYFKSPTNDDLDDAAKDFRRILQQFYSQKANSKISKFMINNANTNQNTSVYLNRLCGDSSTCMVFGLESKKILKFFNYFIKFNYLDNIRPLPVNEESNGFIHELKYTHRKYNAHALLKSNQRETSSNLIYEYIVGLFINEQAKFFPCFIETYGLFKYNNIQSWEYMKNNELIDINLFKSSINLQEDIDEINEITLERLDNICKAGPILYSILIQNIKGAQTLEAFYYNVPNIEFINEFKFILFQIYMPLYCLGRSYTHYDLHPSNILIYKPVNGKCINFHYDIGNGEIIHFKSPYIVKIIDYGRNYFYIDEFNNTKIIFDHMKKLKLETCYPGIYGNASNNADLLTLFKILDYKYPKMKNRFNSNSFKYADDRDRANNWDDKDTIHLKPDTTREYKLFMDITASSEKRTINTISDIYNKLKDILKFNNRNPNFLNNSNNLGDLYIFTDGRPLTYISTQI